MEDSPLSITANIAGILTLTAAIAASLLVRFKVLQDGYDELTTTRDSVMAYVGEVNVIEKIVAEGDTRPAAVRMQNLFTELLGIEFSILEKCNRAYGSVPQQCDPEGRPGPKASPRRNSQPWALKLRRILTLHRDIGATAHPLYIASITYTVRDEVRDKVRQRDLIRSQILHQQMVLLHMDIYEVKSALCEWKAETESSRSLREDSESLEVGDGRADEQDAESLGADDGIEDGSDRSQD